MTETTLGLTGATNARDLGGIVTRQGRRVRSGVLFRANALNRLTDADLEILIALGLTCVIDFRNPEEAVRVGLDRLPTPAPKLVPLPIFDPDHDMDVFAVIGDVVQGKADASELDFLSEEAPGGGAHGMMLDIYRRFVTGAPARAAFGEALRLAATELPLLFHCTAGKDRTGWLAALILTVLGVDRDVIMADYLRTNELSAGSTEFVLTLLGGKIPDPRVIVPMMEARAAYLEAGFAEAERVYGSVEGYVRDGLGADDALLTTLRTRLLG